MRAGFFWGTRGNYYDRAPLSSVFGFVAANAAPHGQTVRVSYTVPTGRLAVVELINLMYIRVTTASPVTEYGFLVDLVNADGGNADWINRTSLNNNLAFEVSETHGTAIFLRAGQQIRLITFDGSTGGTVTYRGGMKITEFSP